MTTRREETIDTVCERLALGKTLSHVCRTADACLVIDNICSWELK